MSAFEKQFLIECLTADLCKALIEEYGWDMQKSLDTIYGSHTYEQIEDERTGLYYQSPVYVLEFLERELTQ